MKKMNCTLFRTLLFVSLIGLFLYGTVGASLAEEGDFVLPKLQVTESDDGNAVYNAGKPLVMVVDPRPEMQGIRTVGSIAANAAVVAPDAATSTFTIDYVASGGSDPWGAACVTFPTEAKTAFQAAATIWASKLQSTVPIKISACWSNIGSSSTLGYSGGGSLYSNFTNAPRTNTYYISSLANSLYGADLNTSKYDMYITYNTIFPWYYGTDGNTPAGKFDLVTVAAHEIAHGLGFSGSADYANGVGKFGYGSYNYPDIYDTFIQDGSGKALTSYTNNSSSLGTLLTSSNLWFIGANAKTANANSRVKMYAPSTWSPGSSYSHLDDTTFRGTSNGMMTYSVAPASSNHNPGAVTLGLLKDLGWKMGTTTPTCGTPASITVPAADPDGNFTVTWGASATAGVTYMLQEATNAAFTAGVRTAYTGTNRTFNITSRPAGKTYYYRVKATKTGYTASAWKTAANYCYVGTTCAVPASITVPATDPDGNFTVSWGVAAPLGVSYTLQEATNSTFTAGVRTAYTGTARTFNITSRPVGKTYYYRVKATKTGFTASAWKTAANGCVVKPKCVAPASISVPATDPDGNFTVTWGASTTTGVTYVLQEATDTGFTAGVRTAYSGTGRTVNITSRPVGKTYYYRVKAIKTGYTDSAWKSAANGCKVGGTTGGDAFEPDNTLAQAKLINYNTSQARSFLPVGDVDFVIVDCRVGTTPAYFYTTGNFNTVIDFYDTYGNFLFTLNDFTGNEGIDMSYPSALRLVVKIRNFNATSGSYGLAYTPTLPPWLSVVNSLAPKQTVNTGVIRLADVLK